MIVESLPFHEENTKDTIRRICNRDFEIPEFISDETRYLIDCLFQTYPKSRLTTREILMYERRYEGNEFVYYDIPTEIEC
jgi:hypothetical protein